MLGLGVENQSLDSRKGVVFAKLFVKFFCGTKRSEIGSGAYLFFHGIRIFEICCMSKGDRCIMEQNFYFCS